MRTRKMINLMAGLFFTGILCLNSGAFGYVSSGEACPASEVVFIDPSVPEIEKIVAQLPQGAEVVRLSPEIDGIEQISAHLAKKRDLSAIHIISHGNAGRFVLNGKRIDTDFLRDHGHGISGWGRSLTENGDILLYACNLAATDEGKAFVERFLDLTGADVAASTDVTGGRIFRGDWILEYSMGKMDSVSINVDPNIDTKLTCTWTATASTDWGTDANWSPTSPGDCDPGVPGAGKDVVIAGTSDPELDVSTTVGSFTINANKTLIISGGAISASGNVTNNGTVNAASANNISISAGGNVTNNGTIDATSGNNISISASGSSSDINLNGLITSGTGYVKLIPTGGINLTGNSTVTSTGGTVEFRGTIDGTFTLDVDAGAGLVDFQQAIGSGTNLATLTITQSGGTTFTGSVTTLTSVVLTDTAAGADITFSGNLETRTLDPRNNGNAYNVKLHGGCTIEDSTSFLNTGTTTIGNDSDDVSTFEGGLTATAGPVSIAGTVATPDNPMELGATTQTANSTLNSTGEGSSTITVASMTGDYKLTLQESDSSPTSDVTFTGNLVVKELETFAQGYPLTLQGASNVISTSTSFSNTGTTTIGNDSDDSSTFTGGLTATAGPVSIAGTVATTNTAMVLGATTVSDDSTVNSAGGAVTLGAITINTAKTLIVGTGNTGTISFGSTIDSAAGSTGNLTINTDDTATFSGSVGGTTLGTLKLTDGTVSSGANSIAAGTITVDGGTFGLATSPSGVWDVGNVTIESGATMNATTGAFNVSGNWDNSGTFNHKDGTVTLDGTNQTISGTATFYDLTKTVASAATLTFENGSTNKTTIAHTLTLKGATGQLLSLRSDTAESQWEIDPQGTRAIEFLDVKDSNNVSATNIDAVGKSCTDSGNNTKWSFTQLTSGIYYVDIDTAGNDSNAGTTAAAPWKTLHYAIDRINNGATGTSALPYTLIMAAGTYSTGNGESAATLIVSQSNVAIIGPDHHTIGAGAAIIDGTGTSTDDWIYGINPTSSNITIKDLSIKNFSATGQHGIYMSASTETEVNNCKISNNDTGIELAAGSNNFNIRFCEIYENTTDGLNVLSSTGGEIYRNTIYRHQGSGDDDGIAVFSCSPAIKRNKIYDNDTGIRVEANSTASPDIRNNVIYETTDYVMNYGILVICNSGTASPTIYHNSIDGGSGTGIAIEFGGSTGDVAAPVIKYNIITRFDSNNSVGIDANNASATCNPDYNDVWGNTENYDGTVCTAGTHDISQDPENGTAGPLASTSPCIDAIPTNVGDTVTMDYLGYKRPKGSGYDMGAYEYVGTQTYTDTLPGGTGIETDYRIFTIPLDIGTGEKMQETMETALGRNYDPPTHWRVYARTTSGDSDIEMSTPAFDTYDLKSGIGLWGITILTNSIDYTGTLAPDAIYYEMKLAPGWHLIAVPWPNTSIQLGKIYVTDGVNEYTITGQPDDNRLTQEYIWDYTGTGSTGYTVRNTSAFSLGNGVGFYIKVLGSSNIILSIPPNNSSDPPNNNSASTSHTMSYESLESVRLTDDSEPPPLPGGPYGPVPNIKANKEGGRLDASGGTPVSITVSLDPGDQVGENADWWVVAHTPFDAPLNWYSYVYPEGWRPGIYPCAQTPLFQVTPSFEVLDMALPRGEYTFYFALDENADGIVDETWVDSVDVRVE